ncbi:MAG: hypothetical protein JO089_07510 [Alphaproteobacteria bacterium]|nr:hypothetical protein [Alphaproteobacteria bacterium]
MKTVDEVLALLDRVINRASLETYIARDWVKPVKRRKRWYFEDIDIARLRLVRELKEDMRVDDEGMDIVLALLDQVYGMREQMRRVAHAIRQQPEQIQAEILEVVRGEKEEGR